MGAREAPEMMTDHAFGPVRWKGQYEELFAHLHDLPDVTRIHPVRAQVDKPGTGVPGTG
ncbi:hypothetical protein [Micromonospora sp. 4G55]|uniref:hypothetical protein n=1 Tax=Micromonospora sp. 4G55 TaxID=2806102 RepID=UPI001A60C20E|nr:hypothetical protein [Micromonospora sp. 4G55]MBM0255475.1 hypothetical protein [Micromonospora sp. 4G55]